MIDWNQLEQDREAGTPGSWEVRYERGCTYLYMIDHPDMQSQMCDETYYPWVPSNLTDWERIARVPDLEALALAGRELAAAWENLQEWQHWHSAHVMFPADPPEKDGTLDEAYSRMDAAFAAWRKAEGKCDD